MESKICKCCKKELKVSGFYKNSREIYGVMSTCKHCTNRNTKSRFIKDRLKEEDHREMMNKAYEIFNSHLKER